MPSKSLKIAILSHDITWGDKHENIITVAELLNRIDCDTDIVVLPELFNTGFLSTKEQISEMAEDFNGDTIINLQRWAQYFGFAICGSMLAKEGYKYYNRAFFVEPMGDITYYDKRHLFSFYKEDLLYEKGTKQSPIIRFRGWNISMQICYDIKFPVWCRSRNNNIDIILVPANTPEKSIYEWKQLLIARAIENQLFIVGANRSGKDDYGKYVNSSFIYDFQGNEISIKSQESTLIQYAYFDNIALNRHRIDFPTCEAADLFEILQ